MKYVDDRTLAAERKVHRATIWRMARRGDLPQPVRLSNGCTRWLREEVDARDAERAAARSKGGAA